MKDQNVVFALEDERRRNVYLHDRPAAKALWAELSPRVRGSEAVCLVTGEQRRSRACIRRSRASGARRRRVLPSSRSISTPSHPTATSRATMLQSRRRPPSPTRRRSTAFLEQGQRPPHPDRRRFDRVLGRCVRGARWPRGRKHLRRDVCAASTKRPRRSKVGAILEAIRNGQPLDGGRSGTGRRRPLLRARPCAQRRAALDPLLFRGRFRRHRDETISASSPTCDRAAAARRAPGAVEISRRDRRARQARERAAQSRRRMDARDPHRHALSADAALDRADAASRRQAMSMRCVSGS